MERLIFRGAGVDLVADATGDAGAPTVLFLHGGGQTRHSWRKALVEGARRGYRAIALDLRGHGDSGWAPDGGYALPLFADDLRAVLGQIDGAPMVVGASLGGLTAMLVAGSPPPAMRALILVDITARVDIDGAREVMAFMRSAQGGFASLDEAADAVEAYLPHRARPKNTTGLARNLRLRDGRYYWHWDPAFMRGEDEAEANDATADLLQAAAAALTLPTLLVRGGRSTLVSEAGAREFIEMVPHADYVSIADAHHMVAGDANDAFNQAVFAFLDRQVAAASR